jgi:hypothetical protein
MKKIFLLCILFYSGVSAFSQGGTDIILFDITITSKGISLANPVNITDLKGYDNQPFFHKTAIYYSSQVDTSQMDIKKYDYVKKTTSFITQTIENEFSPTVTPDGKFISCILQRKNGKQDLVKYPLNGGEPLIIIDDLKVGYHTWITKDRLLLFVLEDTSTFGLHYYNTSLKKDKKITANIGRGLNKIPGKNSGSFIQKDSSGWMIKEYNPFTNNISAIVPTLPNRDFFAWTNKGLIIMSDGKDLFYAKPGNSWQKININSDMVLKNITRLAINEKNNKLAVVVAE